MDTLTWDMFINLAALGWYMLLSQVLVELLTGIFIYYNVPVSIAIPYERVNDTVLLLL